MGPGRRLALLIDVLRGHACVLRQFGLVGDVEWRAVADLVVETPKHVLLSFRCTRHMGFFLDFFDSFDSFHYGIAGSPDRACSNRAAWCVTLKSKKALSLSLFLTALPLRFSTVFIKINLPMSEHEDKENHRSFGLIWSRALIRIS